MKAKERPTGGRGGGPALRVLIADRSAHFRETLRRVLLQCPNNELIAEAQNLARAVRLARELRPEVVLLDVDLVIDQPATRLRRLAEAFPHLRVVVMLNEDSADYRHAVLQRWGYPCMVKSEAEGDGGGIVSAVPPARRSSLRCGV